jgi:hypothetical protein
VKERKRSASLETSTDAVSGSPRKTSGLEIDSGGSDAPTASTSQHIMMMIIESHHGASECHHLNVNRNGSTKRRLDCCSSLEKSSRDAKKVRGVSSLSGTGPCAAALAASAPSAMKIDVDVPGSSCGLVSLSRAVPRVSPSAYLLGAVDDDRHQRGSMAAEAAIRYRQRDELDRARAKFHSNDAMQIE